MSEQTLKRIFGGLGILVVLWLGSVWLSGRGRPGAGPTADGGVAAFFEGLSETTVSAVRIAGPVQTLSLQPSGGAWTVNGYGADSMAVARFWNALAAVEVGGVVANNPSNHVRMGLVTDSAWTVDFTLADGGTASVLVGKRGPISPSAYVRLPDQDTVVVVSGDFRTSVTLGLSDWRDRTILRVDTAAVVRIVLETDEGTYVTERTDSTWSVDGEPAIARIMDSVLEELARLLALGFADDGEASEESPKRVIALGATGDTLGVVLITGVEAGTRHARTPGSDVVFEIASFRADRVAPDIATVRAASPGVP